jgi:hypothetical protein
VEIKRQLENILAKSNWNKQCRRNITATSRLLTTQERWSCVLQTSEWKAEITLLGYSYVGRLNSYLDRETSLQTEKTKDLPMQETQENLLVTMKSGTDWLIDKLASSSFKRWISCVDRPNKHQTTTPDWLFRPGYCDQSIVSCHKVKALKLETVPNRK